jgi:NADH:ubiquinone oxidoreductase subunit E/FixJ family two-component response regulator
MMASSQAAVLKGNIDVVVIDDEDSIREGSRQALESDGYRAAVAADGKTGLTLVKEAKPRVVLIDLRMPGISGMEILEKLHDIDPSIVPIVITGYGSIDSAVNAMKLGAFDFLTKPFDMDQLLGAVHRGVREHEAIALARPPSSDVAAPTEQPPSEADVVLKSLEALAEYQSLGLTSRGLTSELQALETEARYHATKLGQIKEKGKAISEMASDLRLVDRVIRKHGFKRNALIQVLLEVQAAKRWLPRHIVMWIARRLDVPLSRAYEVANFYEAFSLAPRGRHTVQICMGTTCHIRHSPELSTTVSAMLGIKPGETDSKMNFTLQEVHCLGCCALAPVMKFDETYHRNPSYKELKQIFKPDEGKR